MEAVLHFAHNADSEAEVSYLRNLPILKAVSYTHLAFWSRKIA